MSEFEYIERPRTIEARQITTETASEVAAWCGGPDRAMTMPDGSVLYKVGDVWLTAPVGSYLIRERENWRHELAAEFEAQWMSPPRQDAVTAS